MLEEGAGPGFWRRLADTDAAPGFPPRCRQGCPGELARLQGERAVALASHTGKPAGGGGVLRDGGSSCLLQRPLLTHIFEIYGEIFGQSQWGEGHRWVAWEGSEKPGLYPS